MNRVYRLCKQDMSELPMIKSYDQLLTALALGKLRDLMTFGTFGHRNLLCPSKPVNGTFEVDRTSEG
jgi:hypothetical protein